MMGEIYNRALGVFVWLGRSEESSGEALQVLTQIENETLQLRGRSHHGYSDNPERTEAMDREIFCTVQIKWFPDGVVQFDLRSTQEVLQRSWFRRVWVLQEAALNGNVTCYCGKDSITKHVLWAGARTITALANEILESVAGTNFISRRTLSLVRTSQKRSTLETLLTATTMNLGEWAYEASDPRDRIFAILGLSSDSSALNVYPNYEDSCENIYLQVAEAILASSDTLDILYAISGPQRVKAVPSWTPDWSFPIPSAFGLRKLGRFSASGPLSHSSPTFLTDQMGNRLLSLTGFRVDTVEVVMDYQWDPQWEICFNHSSPVVAFIQTLHKFGRRQQMVYAWEEERTDALWKTPIADCDATFSVTRKHRPPASLRTKDSFDAFMGVHHGDIE